MGDEQTAVFGIVDALSTRYGNTLTGNFARGDKIALSTFRPITSSTKDVPTEYAGKDPVYIHFLQPEFIFDDPILRSLIAEANSTFVALQALKRSGTKADYTKISRTYRSIIRACLEKLQDATITAELEECADNQTKYQQYITIFYSIECVWHLSEILFLDPTPSNVVAPQLLDWIRFHFPASERMATDLLLLGREANDNADYWPALKGLIMQGQVDVARAILQLHPLAESAAFKMSDQIFKAMPTYSVYGGFSIQKFRSQWQYWLTDTERKLAANILSVEPNLEELIQNDPTADRFSKQLLDLGNGKIIINYINPIYETILPQDFCQFKLSLNDLIANVYPDITVLENTKQSRKELSLNCALNSYILAGNGKPTRVKIAMKSFSLRRSDSALNCRSLPFMYKYNTHNMSGCEKLGLGPPWAVVPLKLITGETQIWNAQIQISDYWYEYLPGYLYYTNPACKHFELGAAANAWLDRWMRLKSEQSGRELQLKHLDRVILNLMENDMHQVIHSIQLMADNQWFVTHLTDLLYNCGQLKIVGEHQVNDCIKLRESLLFDFGSCLMTRNSLWQLGMDYLDYCSTEGKAALELLLTKIPIRTEKQALKIIEIARKKGFNNAEQEICKVQAKRSLDEHRYGNALEWAIRSRDTLYVTSIADFLLNHYAKTGDMLCPDVIANIGAKMFISPRLVFLVKYFDFYQFYRKREFLPAAELLVNLLESKITPEYFWPSLLIDSIPLLESKDPKILSKETCAILHHLESELVPLIEKKKKRLEKFPDESINILKDYRIENIEEIINLLRLACARNLSRAIIIENTIMG